VFRVRVRFRVWVSILERFCQQYWTPYITVQYGLDIEVGAGSCQNLPSGYPMIVPSLRSCLAGLPTREATAEVRQLLQWRRVRAVGTDMAASDMDGLGRYFRRCCIFLQGENSATQANGRHLARRIFRHCSVVLLLYPAETLTNRHKI